MIITHSDYRTTRKPRSDYCSQLRLSKPNGLPMRQRGLPVTTEFPLLSPYAAPNATNIPPGTAFFSLRVHSESGPTACEAEKSRSRELSLKRIVDTQEMSEQTSRVFIAPEV